MMTRKRMIARALLFLVTLVVAGGLCVPHAIAQAAQQPAPTAQASPEIHAVLEKMVHVKKAKVGDTVTARVTETVKLKDGTEITKGSKLVGKVTEVKAKADKEGPAKLGLLFDKAQLKDGKEVPVTMALVSVAPHWEPGGVDPVAAENKMASAGRIGMMSDTQGATSNTGGDMLTKGLGVRGGSGNREPNAMQPGVSYLDDISIATYAMGTPGTVLESKKGTFYVDSGSRLLLMAP